MAAADRPWVVYVRVSTDEQAAEGVSLAAQREACLAMLRAGGAVVAEVIEDAGWSAKNLQRPGIQRALGMIDRGEIAGICIYRLDRLTRTVRDLLELVERFDKAGAAMRSVSEMLDTQTPMGRFFMTLLAAMAQWERETIATRVKMGMKHRIAAGGYVGSAVPAGCRVIGPPGNKTLEAIPEWKPVATAAWAMASRGASLSEIVRWLTDQQFPIPKANGRKAVAWNTNNLHFWLNNEKLVGLLVDRETFDAAHESLRARWSPKKQKIAQHRQAATDRVWPFRGLLRCANCGQMIIGTAATGRSGKLHHYLRCSARNKASIACRAPDLPADAYERALIEAIVDKLSKGDDVLRQMAEASQKAQAGSDETRKRHDAVVLKRDAVKVRIDRLLDLVADGSLAGGAAKERIGAEQRTVLELEHEIAQLRGELARAEISRQSAEVALAEIRRGVERLKDAPPAVQAQGLRLIIDRISLSADFADIYLWLPDSGSYGTTVWRSLSDDVRTTVGVTARFEHRRQGTGRKWVVRVAS